MSLCLDAACLSLRLIKSGKVVSERFHTFPSCDAQHCTGWRKVESQTDVRESEETQVKRACRASPWLTPQKVDMGVRLARSAVSGLQWCVVKRRLGATAD